MCFAIELLHTLKEKNVYALSGILMNAVSCCLETNEQPIHSLLVTAFAANSCYVVHCFMVWHYQSLFC